jgi:hypothetical protein
MRMHEPMRMRKNKKKFNSANQHKEERKEQTVMKSPGQ